LSEAAARRDGGFKPRLAWVVVGFLWLTFLLNYVDRQLVFSIFPVLRRELGFTDAQLGLAGSVFIWTYCVCMAPAGRLADVLRRDRLILASLVLWSLATLGTGISSSPGALLFWRAMMGVTESLYAPAAFGLIASLHNAATRSRALAAHGTAQLVGSVFGGWYGGWMAERFGWRTGFFVLAIAGFAWPFLLSRALARVPRAKPDARGASARPSDVLRSRCFNILVLGFTAFGVMLWMLYAWLPNFIYERYGLSMAQSGLAATLFLQSSASAGVLVGGFLADWLAKRTAAGRFYVVGAGLLLSAPFAYLTLAVDSLLLLKFCAAGFGLFAGLVITNAFAAAYDVVAPRNYGLAAGILNSVPGIASGTAVFVVGAMKSSLGITKLMAFAALAALGTGVLLLITAALRFERDRRAVLPEQTVDSSTIP
jgi:MFS family permease